MTHKLRTLSLRPSEGGEQHDSDTCACERRATPHRRALQTHGH